jgi:hypothetical protein
MSFFVGILHLFFFVVCTCPSLSHQVEERHDIRHYLQVEVQPKAQAETEAINPQSNYSKCFDDDGRLKRTGEFYII